MQDEGDPPIHVRLLYLFLLDKVEDKNMFLIIISTSGWVVHVVFGDARKTV